MDLVVAIDTVYNNSPQKSTVKSYPMKILAAPLLFLTLPVTAATLEGRVVG